MGITPDNVVEIFLQPGDFYFGDQYTRIRTLLGSCVSITMWHPLKLIGGMCHFMLPYRPGKPNTQLDGRYADEAVLMFFREAVRYNTHPAEYVIKVFGGGRMFPTIQSINPCENGRSCSEVIDSCQNISCRNSARSIALLQHAGLSIDSHDLGGTVSRYIVFDIWDGNVWMRKNIIQKSAAAWE